MKMHSYITVNGQLQVVRNESESLLTRLKAATSSVGGWDNALEVARDKLAEQQSITAPTSTTNTNQEPTPIGTPPVPEGLSASYVDAKTANALRKRLTAISRVRSSDSSNSTASSLTGEGYRPNLGPGNFPHYNKVNFDVNGVKSVHKPQSKDSSEATVEEDAANDVHENLVPHVLVYHPDEKIAALAHEYSELRSGLVSSGPEYVTWPDTITWKNFAVYQLIPTLVYELEYPRTDRLVICLSDYRIYPSDSFCSIRPLYLFEKTVSLPTNDSVLLLHTRFS